MRWASLVYVSLPLSCWLSTCSCGFVCLDLFDCVLAHVRLFAFACTKLLRVSNPPHSRVQVFPWPSSLEWLSFEDWAPGRIGSNCWRQIPEANAFSCVRCAARKKAWSKVLRLAWDAREKHSCCPLRAMKHSSNTKKHCLRHPPTTLLYYFLFACLLVCLIVWLTAFACTGWKHTQGWRGENCCTTILFITCILFYHKINHRHIHRVWRLGNEWFGWEHRWER